MKTKYNLLFSDLYEVQYLLELQKDYNPPAGSEPTSLIGAGSPVVLSDVMEGSRKIAPIRGSEMKIKFHMEDVSEFESINDREYKVRLSKKIKDGFRGECEISTLAAATSEDNKPTGQIEITSAGNYTYPTCNIGVTIGAKMNGTWYIYAVPEDNSFGSDDKIILATVQSLNSAVIDDDAGVGKVALTDMLVNPSNYDSDPNRLVTINSDGYFEDISDSSSVYGTEVRWHHEAYNDDISPGWQIKQTFVSSSMVYTYYNFTAAPIQPRIDVFIYDTNWDSRIVATYFYTVGETTDSIALDLADSLDATEIENVLFDDGIERDIILEATATGSVIDIEITNLGSVGNIPINKTLAFDGNGQQTIQFLVADTVRYGASYDFTTSGFTGGDDTGEYFRVEFETLYGWSTLAETTRQPGDTKVSILNRLATTESIIFNFYVEDEILYLESTSSNVGWNYRFLTDGNSTLIPATSTAMYSAIIASRIWEGWVLSGLNTYQMRPGKKVIELTASDGLGDLKNIDFEVNETRPFEKLSLLKVITTILNETGLRLKLYDAFNLHEVNIDDTAPAIAQIFQDTSRLREMSSYEVLEETLRVMGLVLYQNYGVWETKPLGEYTGYNVNIYQQMHLLTSETKSGNVKEAGGDLDNKIIAFGEMGFEAGWREVVLKQNYGFVDQLIKFPMFNGIEKYLRQDVVNIKYSWVLYLSGDAVIDSKKYVGFMQGLLRINPYYSNPGPHQLRQTVFMGVVEQKRYSDGKQYELTIRYQGAFDFTIYFFRKSSETASVKHYLYKNDEGEFVWTDTGESGITVPGGGDDLRMKTFTASFDWDQLDLPGSIGENGVGVIAIEQKQYSQISLESIELKVNTIMARGQKKTSYYSEQKDVISSEKYEEEISLGDVPVSSNLGLQAYRNSLYYFDDRYKLTGLWSDGVNELPLLTHLRRNILKEYPRAARVINGEAIGNLKLRDILLHKGHHYMLTGGEWNVRTAMLRGEWQEIDMAGYTLVEKTLPYEDSADSSGSTSGGVGGDVTVDLSDYLTENEVLALIQGYTETFTGADLTNRQKTIYHNLGWKLKFAALYIDGVKQSPANFEINDNDNTNNCILTVNIQHTDSTTFEIRIL